MYLKQKISKKYRQLENEKQHSHYKNIRYKAPKNKNNSNNRGLKEKQLQRNKEPLKMRKCTHNTNTNVQFNTKITSKNTLVQKYT